MKYALIRSTSKTMLLMQQQGEYTPKKTRFWFF